MKIFLSLKDFHAELPGLTMLDFFLSVASMTRFGVGFKEKVGRLVFTFSQILTSLSHNFHDLQPILDCSTPKVKLKYQQFKIDKTKLVS